MNSYTHNFDTTTHVEKLRVRDLGDLSWSKWLSVKKNEFFGIPADTNVILETTRNIDILEFENSSIRQAVNWLNRYPSERNLDYFKEHILPHYMTGKKEFNINQVLISKLEVIDGTDYKRVLYSINPKAEGVVHSTFRLSRNIISEYIDEEHPVTSSFIKAGINPANIRLPISEQNTGLSINPGTKPGPSIVGKGESTPSSLSDFFPRVDSDGKTIIKETIHPDSPSSTSSSLEIQPGTPRYGFLGGSGDGLNPSTENLATILLPSDFVGKNPIEAKALLNAYYSNDNYNAFAKYVKVKFDINPQHYRVMSETLFFEQGFEDSLIEKLSASMPAIKVETAPTNNVQLPTIPDEAHLRVETQTIFSENTPSSSYPRRFGTRSDIDISPSTLSDRRLSSSSMPATFSEQLGLPMPKPSKIIIDSDLSRKSPVLVASTNPDDIVTQVEVSNDSYFTPSHQVNPSIDVNERLTPTVITNEKYR